LTRYTALALTTTVDTAASILGISRTKAYALAKAGDFPIRLVRVGRRYLVPVPALFDLLGSSGTVKVLSRIPARKEPDKGSLPSRHDVLHGRLFVGRAGLLACVQ
jgi:excisionase family DNA binding protein